MGYRLGLPYIWWRCPQIGRDMGYLVMLREGVRLKQQAILNLQKTESESKGVSKDWASCRTDLSQQNARKEQKNIKRAPMAASASSC